MKFCWIIVWVVLITLIMFFPIVFSALVIRSPRLTLKISNIWPWVILKASFVTVEVEGRDRYKKGESYIIISNHQSYYDILALVTHLGIPFRWIIKKELRKVPLFGYALHASNNVFVDRKNRESSVRSIREGLTLLPKGVSIIFFAEGTRTGDGQIGEFKKGGFVSAIETQRGILPVTIIGSRDVLPKGKWAFSPGKIRLIVDTPIPTNEYSPATVGLLMDRTRSIIITNLKRG